MPNEKFSDFEKNMMNFVEQCGSIHITDNRNRRERKPESGEEKRER